MNTEKAAGPKKRGRPPKPKPGPIELSVMKDFDRLKDEIAAGRDTLKQMALRLAQAYDQWEGTDLAKLARLNQELRQTLAAVMDGGDESGDESDSSLPAATWNAPES